MVFCNRMKGAELLAYVCVTILILIDGFLQFDNEDELEEFLTVTILILIDGFLQCICQIRKVKLLYCHNPYFNRWFSAMASMGKQLQIEEESQSLF